MTLIPKVSGIGTRLAAVLAENGITTAEQLAATLPADLLAIPGIGAQRAKTLLTAATLAVAGDPPKTLTARRAFVAPAARKASQPAPANVIPAAIADEVETAVEKEAKEKKSKAKKKEAAEKAANKKKIKKKAAAKNAAVKKAEKKKDAKEKVAAKKIAKGKKTSKKRVKKAIKKKKAKKAAREALKAKVDKKAV